MDHPDTYSLTRAEWLAINRALAGAHLSMVYGDPAGADRRRLRQVQDAQTILSAAYDSAVISRIRGENAMTDLTTLCGYFHPDDRAGAGYDEALADVLDVLESYGFREGFCPQPAGDHTAGISDRKGR